MPDDFAQRGAGANGSQAHGAGVASGVSVSLWSQPLDVWRTREQVLRRDAGASSGALRGLLRAYMNLFFKPGLKKHCRA